MEPSRRIARRLPHREHRAMRMHVRRCAVAADTLRVNSRRAGAAECMCHMCHMRQHCDTDGGGLPGRWIGVVCRDHANKIAR